MRRDERQVKKDAEKCKRALIHQILDIALDINGLGVRNQEDTGNLPTTFFNVSGHVGTVEVGLFPEGWKQGAGCWSLPYTHTDNSEELMEAVRALKAETPGGVTPRESR